MAKQVIISAMEEVFGEYVLNISKDNLKIAAIRGKIKLENVQLDGDLLGSHILGAVGLSGFGVLSCSAKSIKITIPWNNLEKEPTRFQVRGIHLVCVPLTPSTANILYGSGTKIDPRCSLRTRAKRLILGRFERNYWNGLVPDEGPPMKRITRAVREVTRDVQRSRGRSRSASRSKKSEDDVELDEMMNNLMQGLTDSAKMSGEGDDGVYFTPDDLPELPRDWKVRLREKALRNMEASIHGTHIRCEVPVTGNEESSGERAFALGFTLASFVVRTANEKWEVGSHDKRNPVDGSAMSSEQGHLGPNEYVVKNNKIGYFNDLSIYCDVDPVILLAETDLLQGNLQKLSPDQLVDRISAAMEAMTIQQEPGNSIRKALFVVSPEEIESDVPHRYICRGLKAEIRSRSSDRMQPGPVSCSADALPFEFCFDIHPDQYMQYQKLRAAMKAQQRFDTMLRQRPTLDPMQDPRAWWKYAIACVTSRPNGRAWEDVLTIVRHRARYIELVVKKNFNRNNGTGYHSGLSESESTELLQLEDLMPIEALLAFHLLALRRVYEVQKRQTSLQANGSSVCDASPARGRPKLGFSILRGRSLSLRRDKRQHRDTTKSVEPDYAAKPRHHPRSNKIAPQLSLVDAMTLRLGKKVWFVDWRLHEATMQVKLRRARGEGPELLIVVRASGSVRSFGRGKRDFFFDVTKCDLYHGSQKIMFADEQVKEYEISEDEIESCSVAGGLRGLAFRDNRHKPGPDLSTPSGFLDFPPYGTVCRLAAGKDSDVFRMSLSAHPLTLVCTTSTFDSISAFLPSCSSSYGNMAEHIKNAATPLARKAQFAFLSPASSALYVNITAPKIWVPIVSRDGEAALLIDAGTMRIATLKEEGQIDSDWSVKARDIQVNFVRGCNTSRLYRDHLYVESLCKGETYVIRPFSIEVISELRNQNSFETKRSTVSSNPLRMLESHVSPLCISLIDAEMLARSFGKWYAKVINRLRSRVTSSDSLPDFCRETEEGRRREEDVKLEKIFRSGIPKSVTMKVEKVEVVVEGHSKRGLPVSYDEKSWASRDSAVESSPQTRTYLVEVFSVTLHRSIVDQLETTTLAVSDASIGRLLDGSLYIPLKVNCGRMESENQILVCNKESERRSSDSSCQGVLNVTFVRDGYSHLDEVEVDVESVMLRVTPMTLKDCTKAFRKIIELAQVATSEMERKVHEAGRKARRYVNRPESPSFADKHVSPSISDEVMTEFSVGDKSPKSASDSSILFKLTVRESTILAGRPATAPTMSNHMQKSNIQYAVIQLLSNALVMFQSIENPDGSGHKTLHVSVDNVSSLVNKEFERLSPQKAPPMIGPFGAEFRVVYATENLGCVVSQDISLNCETVKSHLTPNDLSVMINITGPMIRRLRAFGSQSIEVVGDGEVQERRPNPLATLVRYQKKGTGIVTKIRSEIHAFSFVLLREYKSHSGAPEFIDFNVQHVKLRLEGCLSALSGECSALLSINSFNRDVEDWEYAVEPFPFVLTVEQMPNELLLDASTLEPVQVNLTGVVLRDLAEMRFDIGRDRDVFHGDKETVFNPSSLSTLGLRRATESRTIEVINKTGLDVHVIHDSSSFDPDSGFIQSGTAIVLRNLVAHPGRESDEELFSLRLAASAADQVGERETVYDLPVSTSSSKRASLHVLRTVLSPLSNFKSSGQRTRNGTQSPETVLSDTTAEIELAYYSAEPVVEWCMHNQRLRSTIVDLFSLSKGRDLLSSETWSPEDDHDERTKYALDGVTKLQKPLRTNWLRPYLKNDSPEWTDMTCTLRMARDRVMLPDNNWLWVNEWTVDLSGALGEHTDADGWEYQADFETFTRKKRFYERGDACRRRRWTRTRMVRPPKLNDPRRQLKFVWETTRDQTGNSSIVVRSNLRVKNRTLSLLSVFLFNPSWDNDHYVGSPQGGEDVDVPILFSSAAYMRIGKPADTQHSNLKADECSRSDRFMILPTSHSSVNYIRTSIALNDVSSTVLHYLVEVRSDDGIVNITVEPVFRLANLLPCQVECQVGEVVRMSGQRTTKKTNRRESSIALCETITIGSGKEGCCTAVDPQRKPHVSLRVPGYQWSHYQRVVNRKASSNTWRPCADEEEHHFLSKGDSDYADEWTTTVHLERSRKGGDPLILLLSIECGHCPTLRVYAQYWIVDKTGFGCRFSDGFVDMLSSTPNMETSRRSYMLEEDMKLSGIRNDLNIPGHQWSIGTNGMSLYFSKREKLTLCLEARYQSGNSTNAEKIRSKWISPLDISNVMPKTVFSVEELNGHRLFEFAFNVTLCSGIFSRTKMISLFPRYQIVNLLHREIVLAQDEFISCPTLLQSQSTLSFHWESSSSPQKIRIGAPTVDESSRRYFDKCWSSGRLQLDKVGITSMRLPSPTIKSTMPMVIQAEVSLANKDQSSAVVIVIWSANERSNPLYVLRNRTLYTILCRQPIRYEQQNKHHDKNHSVTKDTWTKHTDFECGTDFGQTIRSLLGLTPKDEFVWSIKSGEQACFGFDNPERAHILEWTYASMENVPFDSGRSTSFVAVDAMGSSSVLQLPNKRPVYCNIKAEHSTKVIEFVEDLGFDKLRPNCSEAFEPFSEIGVEYQERFVSDSKLVSSKITKEDEEDVTVGFRLDIPSFLISVIDNADPLAHGREILLGQAEKLFLAFSQSREGYHEFEARIMSMQIDNHVRKSIHPILLFYPKIHSAEPLFHMSAVRRLQNHSNTFVFRYAAIRLLEIEIFLDRRTAETIAKFIEPLTDQAETEEEHVDWLSQLVRSMEQKFKNPDLRAPRDFEKSIHLANSGRIYFEQLHLHPVRISLTFTQEWMDWSPGAETVMLFQFIRGMASIANAPLVFTSFVVEHVFEAPQALVRVISTHYSSQLTKQIFGILGSLAILGAPADFISNVGTGVRDFFYEPIQGAVHGPRQFIEGLEAGTQSLARGVFVGVVRGAASVTEVVNANLAGLTADDEFLDERRAHQRMMTDAMSRGTANRTFADSLYLAGASVVRSVQSGAFGIIEQPSLYASKHGPIGFVKGVGKAIVGAVVKPVVGLGDAAVVVMNHVSDATSKKRIIPKIPIRIRRALPSRSSEKLNSVRLEPYDEKAAKAQKIVTAGDSIDDVYLGHINTPNHLIIASEQCLWAIDRRSREPWCVNWEEISHFGMADGRIRIVVFSQTGLKTYVFYTENQNQSLELNKLLMMQSRKIANSAELESVADLETLSRQAIPGVKTKKTNHVFGTINNVRKPLASGIKDEATLVEQCFSRVRTMGSENPEFFRALDEEAWSLVSSWGQVFSGLSSRRCIVASIINGAGCPIQIKCTKLLEGGSPCYSIPTKEFDAEQGILHCGGVIIFFSWGASPNLLQVGNVFMHIETNGFICELADHKSRDTYAKSMPGYQVGFLEKSYDDSGWWAKYWLLVRSSR